MQQPYTIPLTPIRVKYAIHEHFYSVQGEGVHSGRAAYFIRLMGCDQQCHFCDSAGTWHPDYKPESGLKLDERETARLVQAPPGAFVVLTGGEPTLYNLEPLIELLQMRGRKVHLETAGHKPLPKNVDWVTLSPKLFAKPPLLQSWTRANEIKLIVESPEQLSVDLERLLAQPLRAKCTIWLHPEWSQRNNVEVLEAIVRTVKLHPNLRAGYQLHKLFHADDLDDNARREIVPPGGDTERLRSAWNKASTHQSCPAPATTSPDAS
jgi:7-carboxy-7-deazaguanine synthase